MLLFITNNDGLFFVSVTL